MPMIWCHHFSAAGQAEYEVGSRVPLDKRNERKLRAVCTRLKIEVAYLRDSS